MRTTFLLTLSIVTAVTASCAVNGSYIYAPEGATHWSDGRPVAITAVPPEAPQGDVQVSSFGITQLTPSGANPVETLHVRMVVTNNGDEQPWTVDTREVMIDVAREGRSRAMFVNTDVASLPLVSIGRGERKTLDFYFPVPSNVTDESNLPAFDVLWQVTTAARPFASRSAFHAVERYDATPGTTEVVVVSGWGPYWWYNPFWVPPFVHRPGIVIRHPPGHVIVSRPPRWHYQPHRRTVVRDHRHRR
ncbi:MAG: uncharacterized protein H6Q90_667 [Deltaproteobacteria bacterium]|nr:uncharacterized protein [Deltaproteobacteria bacterium]